MWKRFTIIILCLAALSTVGAAQQQNFTAVITPQNQDVSLGDTATYTVSVTNQFDTERTFRFSVISFSSWRVSPRTRTLQPGETGNVSISLSVPDNIGLQAGQHGFFVTIYPANNPGQRKQVTGTLSIHRDHSLAVTTVQTDRFQYRPGDTLHVKATVKNVESRDDISGYQLHLLFAGETHQVSVPTISAGSTITLERDIPINRYLVGSHTVTAQLVDGNGGEQHANQVTVDVEQVQNITTSTDAANLALWESEETTIQNKGNVPTDHAATLSVPALLRWLSTPHPEPDTMETRSGKTWYTWEFTDIQPGTTHTVSYRIHYWPLYLLLLALIIGAAIVYRYVYAVTVEKHVIQDETGYRIHVYVKNDTFRDVSHLRVEDHLPGIASLQEVFETREPDRIQRTDDGVDLSWRIDRLHSGEERVFTYRITPQVQVEGSVNLPPAKITYPVHGRELTRLSNKVETTFTE